MKQTQIRTLQAARTFVLKSKVCGIFSDDEGRMACLWDVVDLPDRQSGEKGWGQKVTAVWTWKNELPARWPEEIFYGKLPGGLAALMSLDHLRQTHYPAHYRPLRDCSHLAQRLLARLKLDPLTTAALRKEFGMKVRPEKTRFEKALLELQTTLNIARRNSLSDKNDTWVLFSEQYLQVVRDAERRSALR